MPGAQSIHGRAHVRNGVHEAKAEGANRLVAQSDSHKACSLEIVAQLRTVNPSP
jgi:hypothetical protein